jgi:uracil-DNA glycosylase
VDMGTAERCEVEVEAEAPAKGGPDLARIIDPAWAEQLAPVAERIGALGDFLRAEQAAGRRFLPRGDRILAAFARPFDEVRVLIVGQDPYPTPGHPVGLCFSVAPDVRPVPKSLQNIFREYCDDLGHPPPTSGDLTPWTAQGVLLLNRVLTVRPGSPGSHRGKGWEEVTEHAIRCLVARDQPMVAVLWGSAARGLKPLLGGIPVVESVHPSPLSARSGFFGSRPFSRVNALLSEQGAEPVDWRLA